MDVPGREKVLVRPADRRSLETVDGGGPRRRYLHSRPGEEEEEEEEEEEGTMPNSLAGMYYVPTLLHSRVTHVPTLANAFRRQLDVVRTTWALRC